MKIIIKKIVFNLKKNSLFYIPILLIIFWKISGHANCDDLQFAVELQARTACREESLDHCSIINKSNLFSDSKSFIVMATLEQISGSQLDRQGLAQIDITKMNKLISEYNNRMSNHFGLKKGFLASLNPGKIVHESVTKKVEQQQSQEVQISQEEFDTQVKSQVKLIGQGIKNYYNDHVLPIREEIYKTLGLPREIENKKWTRIREVENLIRAWSEAQTHATTTGKPIEAQTNPEIKDAWQKLFLKSKSGVSAISGSRARTQSNGKQNLALLGYEILDQGAIKIADIKKWGCSENSYSDYNNLTPIELKTLVYDDHCRVRFDSQSLTRVFSDFTESLVTGSSLCRILSDQLNDLKNQQQAQPYKDFEVPQRKDAGN